MTQTQAIRDVREAMLHARKTQTAILAATRSHALKFTTGALVGGAASLSELGNLFLYWRGFSEDIYGDLSSLGYVVTITFSVASFVSLAWAVHALLSWISGEDPHPPYVSVPVGILSLALSLLFPMLQVGIATQGLWARCLFSLLATTVAGVGVHMVVGGLDLRNRHQAAAAAISDLDDALNRFVREVRAEGSRGKRMDRYEDDLAEGFARAYVSAVDLAFDSLTLAARTEGVAVAPLEWQVRERLGGRPSSPEVTELVELTAGHSIISLHRRLEGRSMSPAEASAVREYLSLVHRPTQSEVLAALNSQKEKHE